MKSKSAQKEIKTAGLSAAARALLEQRAKVAAHLHSRIPRSTGGGSAPLSFGQEIIWLSTQLDKNTSAFNRCSALRIIGRLNNDALQRALSAIVERHEVLRSRVAMEEGKPRIYSFDAGLIPLPVIDVPTQARVTEMLLAEATRPFDLETGPLLRAGLLRVNEGTCTLYITTHHIASDGWSDGVMLSELQELYSAFLLGDESPLPEPAIQYRDFAEWQRSDADDSAARDATYWRARLAGAPVAQEFPADHIRPENVSTDGGQVTKVVPRALVESVESIGRHEGATPAITSLAAFVLLQSRLTGQFDAVVGLSFAGRRRAELEGIIGLFNVVVPLRVTVDPHMTFRELVAAVRIAVLEAHEHQSLPVTAIIDSLPQTVFNFRNIPEYTLSLPGVAVDPVKTFNGGAFADLQLEIEERAGTWECELTFRTDLFEKSTAARLLGHYVTLLDSIAQNPDELAGRLQLLTQSERATMLKDSRGPVLDLPRVLRIDELISAQAAKTPLALAVCSEAEALSYVELERQSNALAHELRSRAVANGELVGICMVRSIETIVAVLAVLKCGAAFVPLDTAHPANHIAQLVVDSKPVLVLVDRIGLTLLGTQKVETLLIDAQYLNGLDSTDTRLPIDYDRAAVACVLYTSGSTGLPKGVLSTHRGIASNLLAIQQMFPLDPDDCMLHCASLAFDVTAWEIFWPLTVGAHTCVARADGQRDGVYLAMLIRDQRIANVGFAPSMLKVMLDIPEFTSCSHVKRVMVYGEVLSPGLEEKFFARVPHADLYNLYGPSETSIIVTSWTCKRGKGKRSVPIGRPLPNTEVYVLDGECEPVPVGVAGEIYIGGVCVSNGYLNRPDLTAARFLPHPFRPEGSDRVYRSGDIARFRPDGAIEYIGRRDHQLKIRGVRVELEEIEAALDRLPDVRESVVIARRDAVGGLELIAYVATNTFATSVLDLRRALERELPAQFIPAQIVPLEEIPHGTSGKVDRAALPDPSTFSRLRRDGLEPPITEVEKQLVSIWKEMLGTRDVGIRDSFFNLGGHSLLAVSMLLRVSDEVGEGLSLRDFYREPTIQAMANVLSRQIADATGPGSCPILKVREGGAQPPLFYFNGQLPGGGRYAHKLAPYLPEDRGLYIVPVPIFDRPITIGGSANQAIERIRAVRPKGPYVLAGNCFGVPLALETAQKLMATGESVPLLILIHPGSLGPTHRWFRVMRRLALMSGVPERFHHEKFSNGLNHTFCTMREMWRVQQRMTWRGRIECVTGAGRWMVGFVAARSLRRIPRPEAEPESRENELTAHQRFMDDACFSYRFRTHRGKVAIIWPEEEVASSPPWDAHAMWRRFTPNYELRVVPGNHTTMLHEHFEHSARALAEFVDQTRSYF